MDLVLGERERGTRSGNADQLKYSRAFVHME